MALGVCDDAADEYGLRPLAHLIENLQPGQVKEARELEGHGVEDGPEFEVRIVNHKN